MEADFGIAIKIGLQFPSIDKMVTYLKTEKHN